MISIFKFRYIFLWCICFTGNASVQDYYSSIQTDPNALYAFFKKMPKGGELHYHLAGGVYPETLIALATQNNICIDQKTKAVRFSINECADVSLNKLINNPKLYLDVIRAWSMKDFIPNEETSDQHFFATFYKFTPLESRLRPQALATTLKRAFDQNVLYQEIMLLPDNAKSASFGAILNNSPNFKQKTALLMANQDFLENIRFTVDESRRIMNETKKIMGCEPPASVCHPQFKFQYYVLREQSLNNIFAQALNAFAAADSSQDIIGVNLVQAEDGIAALKDYQKQMQIFEYLHQLYPKVHIALHAGELNPESVTPENLSFHIQSAIFKGHAERIGHGISIAYENNIDSLLKYMANTPIPVEINLTSNKLIFHVEGKHHPIQFYLQHGIPIVLSTDDEGVLRTDIAREYVEAAYTHHLDYPTIKQINRNALTYSFLPGKSLWSNPSLGIPVTECEALASSKCKNFIQGNEKANLQWSLENKLSAFEKNF